MNWENLVWSIVLIVSSMYLGWRLGRRSKAPKHWESR